MSELPAEPPSDVFSWRGRRALVTGGMGFIGSNLAIELVQRGARVTVVDLPSLGMGGKIANIAPVENDVEIHELDVRDDVHMEQLIGANEFIFSLAGQVSHSKSMSQPALDLDLNCRCKLTILECCKRENRDAKIIFPSTRQVYGRPDYLPVDESHPIRPVDVNGVSKFATEQLLSLYSDLYGIRSVSLRLTNTYGPRMDLGDPLRGFAGVFIGSALRGETIRIFGDGRQIRDFNHVSDVVEAMLLAASHDTTAGQSFNLGHPCPASLLEFVAMLNDIVGVKSECIPFPADRKAIDVGDYQGDSTRFRNATGWVPRIDLHEGLQDTIDFFRSEQGGHRSRNNRSVAVVKQRNGVIPLSDATDSKG